MIDAIAVEADLDRGIAALVQMDARFASLFEKTGRPPLRRSEAGYRGVMKIIAGQQVSKASAAAIWLRMEAALAPMEPAHVDGLEEADFRAAGLSGPKIKAVKSLTTAIVQGELDFVALEAFDDQAVVERLCRVKGIGPWSAEVYLLTCLGRPDAWPGGDLALQIAAAEAFELAARPDAKAMAEMAEIWRPWRSVAARLLWAYYAVMLGRQDQGL
ncbi:MAG: DNA-3-methyladenine glycosylase 2 family protein [Alphaproteobacteria bacterium]|nr:DNA-3-methyladenine glycosylase 2 family protein [Alphaproteobacteria bacterium]